MRIKDKLEEIKILIQTNKLVRVVSIFLAFAVLIVFISEGGRSKRSGYSSNRGGPDEAVVIQEEEDPVGELVRALGESVVDTQNTIKSIEERLDRNTEEVTEFRSASTQIFERVTESIEGLSGKINEQSERQAAMERQLNKYRQEKIKLASQQSDQLDIGAPDELEPIFFPEVDVPAPPAPPKLPNKVKFISPADSVAVELLTGVNAPVDGTPYPVVLRLDGPITGPDGSSLDLGGARVIAAAQGSEVDSRVLFRLTNLSIRQPNGQRVTVPVDGWIVGEDGVRGMRGKLIDKLVQEVTAIGIGGGVGALVNNATGGNRQNFINNNQNDPLVVNGNVTGNATGQGINAAQNAFIQTILDRYRNLVPVVEVLSGRKAVAVFSQPVEIGLCEDEQCGDVEANYAALD